jgi:WD40 repeat protein
VYLKIIVVVVTAFLVACNQASTIPIHAKITHKYTQQGLVDAALTKDAEHAVTLTVDRVLSVWDNQTKTLIRQWREFDMSENLYRAAISENKEIVAVAGKKSLSVLNVETGQPRVSWRPAGFNEDASISYLLLDYSGNNVWLGLTDGSIIVVDLLNNKQSMFAQHSGPISAIKLSDNMEYVWSSSTDGSIVYWHSASGKILQQREERHRITSLAIDQTTQKVFSSDALNSHLIWDARNQLVISGLNYVRGLRTFRKSLFFDGGNKLLTTSSKQEVSTWDVRSGDEIMSWQVEAYSMGTTVLAIAEGSFGRVTTLTSDGVLQVWNIND